MWATIRAGRGTAGSLLVWAEGFTGFCQLPSPWQISLWAEPRAGCLGVCSWMQPRGSPAAAVPRVLHCGRAGLLLPLLVLEGPVHSMADGWEWCPCFPKVQSLWPLCGPGAAFPSLHTGSMPAETQLCTWAAYNLYERKWCILVYLSPSYVLLQLLPHPCWTAVLRQGLAIGLAGVFLLQHGKDLPFLCPHWAHRLPSSSFVSSRQGKKLASPCLKYSPWWPWPLIYSVCLSCVWPPYVAGGELCLPERPSVGTLKRLRFCL